MKKNNRKKFNIFILILFILSIISIYHFSYREDTNLSVGQFAIENIISTESFENTAATEQKKQQARNSVSNVYKVLPNIQIETKEKLNSLNSSISELKFTQQMTEEEKLKYLSSNASYSLSDESFKHLLSLNYSGLNKIFSISSDLLNGAYSRGVRENNISNEIDTLVSSLGELGTDSKSMEVIEDIITSALVPNEVLDEENTKRLKDEAEKSVQPVMVEVGDIVVLKGERITEDKVDILIKSGNSLSNESSDLSVRITPYFIIILGTLLLIIYIYLLHEDVYLSSRLFILLIANVLVFLASSAIIGFNSLLIPMMLLAFIINLYVDKKLVVINGIYVSLLLVYFKDLGIDVLLYLNTITFCVTLFGSIENTTGSNFIVAIISSIVSGFLYNFINMLSISTIEFWINIGIAVAGGVVYLMLAIGSGILWESIFGILTFNKLQELSDSNQPLLKLLVEKAPGTYQHSVVVSNLAESAAKAIGANHRLVKAGCLYHDIGKSLRPEYFKENQFGIENPHNQLAPIESAEIILNHVDHGKALAKKHNLPIHLIDFITEHHGDTLVSYFYYNATLEDENVSKELFTYRGKKPQTIETAIAMIVDSCEAATRSIKIKTEESIMDMINSVIEGKIKEEQFIECDLSFSDIEKIKKSLFTNLKSIYHERIEYPKELE